jgi:hypothetical protein
MARANIMMWLASIGNVILAKGFLRVLWLPQPGTSTEKRNLRRRTGDPRQPAFAATIP